MSGCYVCFSASFTVAFASALPYKSRPLCMSFLMTAIGVKPLTALAPHVLVGSPLPLQKQQSGPHIKQPPPRKQINQLRGRNDDNSFREVARPLFAKEDNN